jgi:hypothetical protein
MDVVRIPVLMLLWIPQGCHKGIVIMCSLDNRMDEVSEASSWANHPMFTEASHDDILVA